MTNEGGPGVKSLARPADVAELLERLRRLEPTNTRRWGRMSVESMVCHCVDALLMALGERVVTNHANLVNRTLVKWIALRAPFRWPPGIPTSAEIDQVAGAGTRPGEFGADVARVGELLKRVVAESALLEGRMHPVFGRMTSDEWLRWGYLHTDHHLRQFGA